MVVLSVALNAYVRPFYDLDALGLRNAAYPSRELRTVAINALLLGLPLWLLGRWTTRRLSRRSSPPPRTGEGLGEGDTSPDLPFCLAFVVLALAVILIPEARLLFYYGFMKIDFQHSRISVAMTLPLAIIAVVFLNRFLPARALTSPGRWLAVGLGLGLLLWLIREALAMSVVAQLGPALDAFRPRRLLTLEAVRVLTSLLVLLVASALLVRRARTSWLALAGGVLVAWMVLEAVLMTDHRLNGPQTTQQSLPFSDLDYMQVAPGQMRVPSLAQRAAVHERLEVDQFRTLLLQDRKQFTAMTEPHLAAFWDLRLVEGYSTGLPRRLGGLPWDDSMVDVHHMDVHAIVGPDQLPWRLLAALNVKYVVLVDHSFWFNPAPGGPIPPLDPARMDVRVNPNSVTPRAFFSARVSPDGPTPLLAGDDGKRPAPKDPPIEDPARHSVVEGLGSERTFSTAGAPEATFDGDRVRVRLDPAPDDRFLVLNEAYHPSWHAWVDGAPATVYPTNVVMRGILVPAGATMIELRYEPFLYSAAGWGIMAFGLLLLPLLAWGLRYGRLVHSAQSRPGLF